MLHGHRACRRRRPGRRRWSRPSGCCRRPARRPRPGSRGRRRRPAAAARPGSGPTAARRSSAVGLGEVDDGVEPAGEGVVDVGPQVGGQDGQAVEGLQPLQQVGALDVGVAVVGVLHVAALAEDRVGLVEEQHRVDPAGLGEDPLEVLLGLPDVLVDHRGQVDRVEVEAEVGGDHLGRHGLAGAGVAGEQGGDAAAPATAAAHPPLGEHPVAVAGPRGQIGEGSPHSRGEHEVVPADLGLDPPGQPLEAGGVLGAYAAAQVLGGDAPVPELGRRSGRPRPPGAPGSGRERGARPGRPASSPAVAAGADRGQLLVPQLEPVADGQASARRRPTGWRSTTAGPRSPPRPAAAARRPRSASGRRRDATRPGARPVRRPARPPRSSASRTASRATAAGSATAANRSRSRTTAPIPACSSAATAVASPLPFEPLLQMDQPDAGAQSVGDLAGQHRRVAGRRRPAARPARRRGRRRRAGGRRPGRAPGAPGSASVGPGPRRRPVRAGSAAGSIRAGRAHRRRQPGAPASCRARPTEARRRVTSSLR